MLKLETSDQTILSLITEYAYTRTDAHRLIEIIRQVYEDYLFSGKSTADTLDTAIKKYLEDNQLSSSEKFMLEKLLKSNLTISETNLYSSLESVSNSIKSYPVLTLYVPVDLNPIDVQKIGSWARRNVNPSILLSLLVDLNYLGGCGVSWNGMIKDYGYKYFYTKLHHL